MLRFHQRWGIAALLICVCPALVQADQAKAGVQQIINNGLGWLAKNQDHDGHWEGNGGAFPTAMTGMAGMCFLMEGSTISSGKYQQTIRKATDWYLKRSQPNGLLGNPNNPTESQKYMYGHGFGMLFLACVYGEEEDETKRKALEKLLSKAVLFSGKAQTERGGWGYVSAADDSGFDEGSVTVTQLQGLRAARNAGIFVPKGIIDKANKYLRDCTTPRGGIIYSLTYGSPVDGAERPALTAAAVACAFSAGNYNDPYAKKWLKYCKDNIHFGDGLQMHDEYQNYYFSQCVYVLGDDGYGKLFPDDKDPLKWSEFRKSMFDYIRRNQNEDGAWRQNGIGPVYGAAINLTILQLENGTLPIYQQ
jgi:hypothetical protein